MTYQRLPYDDAATTSEMRSDCTVVGRELHLPVQRVDLPADLGPATPSFGPQGTVEVSDELAQLAAGLQLHFD